MRLNPSKIVFDSISNFVGILLPFAIALVAVPLAIKGLGEERYGLLSIIWVILTYLSLLDFGVSKASSKFLAEYYGKSNKTEVTRIIHATSIFAILIGLLVGVVMMLVTPWIVDLLSFSTLEQSKEARDSLFIVSAALPLLFLGTSLRGAMEASRRFHAVNIGLVITNSLSYAIPAFSYLAPVSLPEIILAIVIIRSLSVVYYGFLVVRQYAITSFWSQNLGSEISRMLRYGSWITVTSVISPLLVYVDRIFIGAMLPLNFVAYYSVPYDLVNRIRIFPQALLKTLFPEFSQLHAENRPGEIIVLLQTATRTLLLIVGITGIVLSVYAEDILSLWLGTGLALKSAAVMTVFGVGFIINAVAFLPFNYLQSIGRPDIPAKLHLIEFPVYLILLFFFTQSAGIIGTAIAWLIRVVVDALLNIFFMIREINRQSVEKGFQPPTKEAIILLSFTVLQVMIQLSQMGNGVKIVSLCTSLLLVLGVIWKYSLKTGERNRLVSMLSPSMRGGEDE